MSIWISNFFSALRISAASATGRFTVVDPFILSVAAVDAQGRIKRQRRAVQLCLNRFICTHAYLCIHGASTTMMRCETALQLKLSKLLSESLRVVPVNSGIEPHSICAGRGRGDRAGS